MYGWLLGRVSLFQSLNYRGRVFHSLLNLLWLTLKLLLVEVFPISYLIHVTHMVFRQQQLSRVLKYKLAVFVVEPENCHIGVLVILNNKNLHHSLCCLPESQLLLLNDLLITHFPLIFLLFSFQLLFVVIDNLELLCHLFWNCVLWVNLLQLGGVLLLCHRVEILETIEFKVRNQAGWIIVSHTDSVRIEHVTHTEFRVLLVINNPNKWAILVSLVQSCLHFCDCGLVFQ